MSLVLCETQFNLSLTPPRLRRGSVPALDFSQPTFVVWGPGPKRPLQRKPKAWVRDPRHKPGAAAPPHRRASHLPTAQWWAHLGSNQERPGYEPGALTD